MGETQRSTTSVAARTGAAFIAAVMAMGLCTAAAPQALADQTDGANGVQDAQSKTIDYQSFDSSTLSWDDSHNEDANAGDYYQDGNVHLFYDTTGGKWDEPGPDPSDPDDNRHHDNGTYVVTIPAKIAYTGMKAGKVDTTDAYTVNVRGLIAGSDSVEVTAESGNNVVNSALGEAYKSDITETTAQGKTTWSAAEVYGTEDADGNGAGDGAATTTEVNPDGSLLGTDATDTIKMTGTARTSGEYSGAVAYTARTVHPVQTPQL